MALTETWLSPGDVDVGAISEVTPSGYVFKHVPRKGRGGGVAVIFKKSSNLKINSSKKLKSFEHMDMTLKAVSKSLRIIIIYRPPPSKANGLTNDMFFSEFTAFLEQLAPDRGSGKILLAGDFNFHVDDVSNIPARRFHQLIESFDYTPHVNTATHKGNHTLDHLLTRTGDNTVSNTFVLDPVLSDHYVVICKLLLPKPPPVKREATYRSFKSIDFSCFRSDVADCGLLGQLNDSTSLEELVNRYDRSLNALMDKHAPVKKKVIIIRPATPWFSPEIQEHKIIKRRLERRWRLTKLTVDRELYTNQCIVLNRLITKAKTVHYSDVISSCGSNQRDLFKVVESLVHGNTEKQYPPCESAELLANLFADFFDNKVSVIREGLLVKHLGLENPLPDSSLPSCEVKFHSFTPVTPENLAGFIQKSASKSCVLDPIPARVLKECFSDLLPVITRMVNTSFHTAAVPENLKSAALDPRLKKSSLSTDEFSSFRPVSNLKFISKCIEKVVAVQICDHVTDNNLDEPFQSAYRKGHSTETALVKVHNDILRSIDSQKSVILLLLDLSAAFDTIDHGILLARLSSRYGIIEEAHDWFRSYLADRTLTVHVSGGQSTKRPLRSGVPQGSILGPILFSLYIAPLGDLLRLHGVDYHLYADDTQLYVTFKTSDSCEMDLARSKIEDCVCAIDKWMTWNRLKLNGDKTELLVLNARHRPSPLLDSIYVCDDVISSSPHARNIGVLMDSALSMEQHVTHICKSGFYHLRNISRVRKYLSFESAETLVHALVTSRLDFCNSVLYGLPKHLVERVQKVQNAAARIVTLSRKCDHISQILFKLHWLPIENRIAYKVLLLTYKAVHGLGPSYINNLIDIYVPRRNLRSTSAKQLITPMYNLKSYGYRAFSCSAPVLWNSLPKDIRLSVSLDTFKSKLKTYLFRMAYDQFL